MLRGGDVARWRENFRFVWPAQRGNDVGVTCLRIRPTTGSADIMGGGIPMDLNAAAYGHIRPHTAAYGPMVDLWWTRGGPMVDPWCHRAGTPGLTRAANTPPHHPRYNLTYINMTTSTLLLSLLAETPDGGTHGDRRRRVERVGSSSLGLVASLALPDSDS